MTLYKGQRSMIASSSFDCLSFMTCASSGAQARDACATTVVSISAGKSWSLCRGPPRALQLCRSPMRAGRTLSARAPRLPAPARAPSWVCPARRALHPLGVAPRSWACAQAPSRPWARHGGAARPKSRTGSSHPSSCLGLRKARARWTGPLTHPEDALRPRPAQTAQWWS